MFRKDHVGGDRGSIRPEAGEIKPSKRGVAGRASPLSCVSGMCVLFSSRLFLFAPWFQEYPSRPSSAAGMQGYKHVI